VSDYPSVRSLMSRFPNPVRARHGTKRNRYCVGGALLIALEEREDSRRLSFPSYSELGMEFQKVNPGLSPVRAHSLADELVDANDRGQFNEAWGILAEVLGESKPVPRSKSLVPIEPEPVEPVRIELEQKEPALV